MVKKILGAGLLGIGVGAGARGLVGVKNMLPTTEPLSAASQQSPIPSTIPVYLPAEQEEANGRLAKTAKQLYRALQHDGLEKLAADGLVDRALGALANFVPSPSSTDVGKSWFAIPAQWAAAGAGAAGGWGLIDHLLRSRRRAEADAELARAKAEYEAAMTGKIASDLDKVYARLCATKTAGVGQTAIDIGNAIGGAYLTALLTLMAGAGYGTYKRTRARSREKLLEKAIKQRALLRRAPQPIMAVASPLRPQPSAGSVTYE